MTRRAGGRIGSDSDLTRLGESRLFLEYQRTAFVHCPFMSP